MNITAYQSFFIYFGYIIILFIISYFTNKAHSNTTFFNGNKKSPWYAVAYGMIGTTLSGVTFISLPGIVKVAGFSYLQMCFGYILGYIAIAYILMPIYYNYQLISIYGYLEHRFNNVAYKTGSSFFLISRSLQAAGKLFLMATVLQTFIFDPLQLPFTVNAAFLLLIISLYTIKGGIKTVVWTDTLQTTFMILAGVFTLVLISNSLDMSLFSLWDKVVDEGTYTKVFNWEINSPGYFWKQFISGAFIVIVMTGLDQDMMQKNLTINTLKKAQLNMVSFSVILFFTISLFLVIGAFLYTYAIEIGMEIPTKSDQLYPIIAQQKLGLIGACIFLLGVIAAAFSSADSAITSLTTAFCIDFLGFDSESLKSQKAENTKRGVHLGFALVLFLLVLYFESVNDTNALDTILKLATYTYGPLLGLFAFGIFMKKEFQPRFIPLICILSPLVCYFLQTNSENWLNGYKFGYELLLLNGSFTFIGLLISSLPIKKS
ncbi:sodium:solute symporter [Flammeovirga sp. MY04]|uniref:sodium:solute symporter n=1 Tax=Flammeovirga sp. MY04 TaxID=1191459 RepID=UPI00080620F3|nr:sodium:solute symporter [Flammeovirga sp. MY04]ANQ50053.1 sodium:solute symporter [Flammeovirga sp. MY04]